ncbi:Chromate transporter [compost metagenome]
MISGVPGALIAAIAVFLPGFLLMVGVLPFWNDLRHHVQVQSFLIGVNAAVVGILLSALYNPLWATAIIRPADFALASILFLMLVYWKLPPWAAVIAGAAGGMVIGYCGL